MRKREGEGSHITVCNRSSSSNRSRSIIMNRRNRRNRRNKRRSDNRWMGMGMGMLVMGHGKIGKREGEGNRGNSTGNRGRYPRAIL